MQTTDQETTTVRFLLGDEIDIPDVFREELGIDESTLLVLTTVDGELRIKPFHFDFNKDPSEKGSPGLRELYEYFAPVREEILASGITQEELFADIDAAIAEVRAERRAWRERRARGG
jgi:hypothetical protein